MLIASRGPAPFLLVRIIIAQVCVSVNLYFIELNSNESANVTVASSAITSVESNWFLKNGKVVQFFITCSTGEISGITETLFSGFPAPQRGARFTGMVANKAIPVRVSIETNGEMKNAYTPISVISNDVLQVSGVYISRQ